MVRKKTETRGHSRKMQAWARNKNKLMNDLGGDVWGRDNKQGESDWEQVTCEDEEDELTARYSSQISIIFALNLYVLVCCWHTGAHKYFHIGLVRFTFLALQCTMSSSVGNGNCRVSCC